MAQFKLLVDTNTYLRLAQTIRPLLCVPFGDRETCLYILPELNHELSNRRLKSRFPWIDEEEYQQNRTQFPTIGRKQQKAIKHTFEFLWDHVQSDLPGPSKVDALYIAYGLELDIPVVTDDQDMTQLAEVFEAKVMPTLALMKLMQDSDHIEMKTVRSIIDYWQAIGDCPANMHRDLKRFFPT
jgi:hypothetical protein